MLVKVCGLSTSEDVQVSMEAGADALGFVFAKSPREVSIDHAVEISQPAKGRVRRVAVMRHPEPDLWQKVIDGFAPDVLQTDVEDLDQLTIPAHIEVWPVYRQGGNEPGPDAGMFLYEGMQSGSGETIDWGRAKEVASSGSMILAGGLHAGNVAAAIAAVRPAGVDASSGVERSRGVKDPAAIIEFVKAARAAEQQR